MILAQEHEFCFSNSGKLICFSLNGFYKVEQKDIGIANVYTAFNFWEFVKQIIYHIIKVYLLETRLYKAFYYKGSGRLHETVVGKQFVCK